MRNASPEDSRDLEKAYVSAITKKTKSDSLPVKSLRMAITTAAGLLTGTVGGFAAGVIDNFFIEKWLNGYDPSLFFDEVQKLKPDK